MTGFEFKHVIMRLCVHDVINGEKTQQVPCEIQRFVSDIGFAHTVKDI